MSVIAVLVTGDPIAPVSRLTPDFSSLIRAIATDLDITWVDIDVREPGPKPAPTEFAACIMTGSPHSVTERSSWILSAEAYLRLARETETPLFGICFGHQLMASAFGGTVTVNPRGREMGISVAEPSSKPASGWPEQAILVPMSHRDTVLIAPNDAIALLRTRRELNAALYYSRLCYSTQFHPEFTPQVLGCYVEHYRAQLEAQGDDVDDILSRLRETPRARQLLRNFIEGALERARRLQRGTSVAAQ